MEIVELTIMGDPMPKQSVKQGKDRYGNKVFYSDSKVKNREKDILKQLDDVIGGDHKLWQGKPVFVNLTYVFEFPKGMSNRLKEKASLGETIYKITSPDVGDNLNKLILDVLEKVVYKNDSEIVSVKSTKVYGRTPRTEISLIYDPENTLFYPKKQQN